MNTTEDDPVTYGDVPLIDPATGRFPDKYAPPSVAADAAAAQGSAEAAAGSASTATTAADTATTAADTATTAAETATTMAGQTVALQDEAVSTLMSGPSTDTLLALRTQSVGRSATVWDVFPAYSALPTSAPTGQPWGHRTTGDDTWVIVDGRLDLVGGVQAGYLEAALPQVVTRMGARWRFDNMSGALTSTGVLALVSWADGGVTQNWTGRRTGMHITIATDGSVEWMHRTSEGGALSRVKLWSLPAFDVSVDHEVEVYRDGSTAILRIDATILTLDDPAIAPVTGEIYACWEPYYLTPATAIRARIAQVWADPGLNVPGASDLMTRKLSVAAIPPVTIWPVPGSSSIVLGGDYVYIPGSTFSAVAGPSGAIVVEGALWCQPAANSLIRIRTQITIDGGTTWVNPLAQHLVAQSTVQLSTPFRILRTGLTPGRSYTMRLEVADLNGSGVVIPGSEGSGRQIIVVATPK